MEVVEVKNDLELWIDEGYNSLLRIFQDELTKEEQAVFLWNDHVELSKIQSRRSLI